MSAPAWRAYAQGDQPAVEDLSRSTYDEAHECAEEWRHLSYEPDPNIQPQGRFVREEADGSVAGYAGIHTEPWMLQTSTRRLDVLPLSDLTVLSQGLDLLEPLLRHHSVAKAELRVLESLSDAVSALTARGYRQRDAVWDLVFDREASPVTLAGGRRQFDGFEIAPLPELLERPDLDSKLHALWVNVASDQPGYDPATTPPLDKFIAWLQSPARLPEGILIAHTNGQLIGLTMLQPRRGQPGCLTQNITGVIREWRRKGVARALKAAGVDYARSTGARKIVTNNSPDNPAIVSLNTSVGFRTVAKWLLLERTL